MRYLLFFSLLTVASISWAAQDWKVVAETTVCHDKIQVMGKDGEKYVIAVRGNEKIKLMSKDGTEFKENSLTTMEFEAPGYHYIHPSYVEANPPKIDVTNHGNKNRCRMELNR